MRCIQLLRQLSIFLLIAAIILSISVSRICAVETTSNKQAFGSARISRKPEAKYVQAIPQPAPTLNQTPPPEAVILFDGSSLDAWASQQGKEWETPGGLAHWRIIPGVGLEVVPGAGSIISKQRFSDFKLHLEFRILEEETNGGVYLLARYELNINDSYGKSEGTQCGAFTNLADPLAPRFPMAAPTKQWQTFDIDFQAPRFNENDVLIEKARATVALNGVTIHDNVELGSRRGAAKRLGDATHGPIMLQEHGTPYQFRNIWIVDKAK